MSADSASLDPYRSPSLPETPSVRPSGSGRPALLTIICVMCIVMGALGIMNGLTGLLFVGMGSRFQEMMTPPSQPGMPNDLNELNKKLQEESAAVQAQYFWPNLVMTLLRVIVAALLLWGGIRAMGKSLSGRDLLVMALAAAIAFEFGTGILLSVMTMETIKLINAFIEEVGQLPQGNGPPPDVLASVTRIFAYVIFGFTFLLIIAKIAFYFFSFLYLRRPAIATHYEATGASAALSGGT